MKGLVLVMRCSAIPAVHSTEADTADLLATAGFFVASINFTPFKTQCNRDSSDPASLGRHVVGVV